MLGKGMVIAYEEHVSPLRVENSAMLVHCLVIMPRCFEMFLRTCIRTSFLHAFEASGWRIIVANIVVMYGQCAARRHCT